MSTRKVGRKSYNNKNKNNKLVTKKELYRAIHSNVENKTVIDRLVTDFSSIGTGWSERIVSIPSQGTNGYERIGNKITIRSLEISGVIAGGQSQVIGDDPWNVLRIVIATWATGTTPLGTAAFGLDYPIRHGYGPTGLLKKYYDKYIPLNVASTEKGEGDGYVPEIRKFKYYKRFKKGLQIQFDDNTTTSPDRRLIISMRSDSAAISHPGFVTGYWVMSFEDA